MEWRAVIHNSNYATVTDAQAAITRYLDDRMLANAAGGGEECLFAVQSDQPDHAFDDVGIDLDAAVMEEAGEALPTRKYIADLFSEFCLLTDWSERACGSPPAWSPSYPHRAGRADHRLAFSV